ncbi:hypothetical protein BDV93DRAFT_553514 [Ceratobasidium sp. AG-I]|nr:hypothetical protein BDV93DRAFT_553514 [Ceratobasidium sp. AG-I]
MRISGRTVTSIVVFSVYILFYLLLFCNDIFMLTFDFRRTHTYVGSIFAQGVFSLVSLAITTTSIGFLLKDVDGVFWELCIPHAFWALSTIFLIFPSIRALRASWSELPLRTVLAVNTKDIILGLDFASLPKLTWKGHVRGTRLSRKHLAKIGVLGLRNVVVRLFFRRVRPAETKLYALIGNTFAFVSMAILIWRTVVSLSQAQTQFETQAVSKRCPNLKPDLKNMQILIKNPVTGGRNITFIEVEVTSTESGAGERPCTANPLASELTQYPPSNSYPNGRVVGNNWFTAFVCNHSGTTFG